MRWLCQFSEPDVVYPDGGKRNEARRGGGNSSGGGHLPPAADGNVPSLVADASLSDARTTIAGDPSTCAEAAQAHTYVGCDYWPTVVANQVWSIFDFAVVVANAWPSVTPAA